MNNNIDFPNQEEFEELRKKVMDQVFPAKFQRPSPYIVFFQSKLCVLISLSVYLCLSLFCALISPENEYAGFLALAVFPLTYFSFFFLSVLSEEQTEVVELKCTLKYSFGYIISLRMLYASLMAIGLNMVMLMLLFKEISNYWSVGAAGTTSMFILALVTLISFERTSSVKISSVIVTLWTAGCFLLMKYGKPLYHLMIEVIPFSVHFAVSLISILAFAGYIRKVEKRNAYSF